MSALSIYIHWPFCKSKCPYCDFNSHVRTGVDNERWQSALLKELQAYARKLPGREVVSIFFGGGTPSLMPAQTVGALIDAAAKFWKMADDVEITLEANPTSIEAQKFQDFRSGGVNRVSVGIQSLSAKDLKFLGREHNVDEALGALELARNTFPRMSFDLIYARPHQTLAAWEAELLQALKYAKDHLSLYQLTIEENTAFYGLYHSGKFTLPEDNLAADMYMLIQDIMEVNGLPAYEISNHAKPGGESRHNLAYWKSDDYIGIGPGAHGRYRKNMRGHAEEFYTTTPLEGERSGGELCSPPYKDRIATENIKSPERWLEKVEQSGNGISAETVISPSESLEEALMMGLRLSSGIHYDDWQRRGFDLRAYLSQETVRRLQGLSLIEADENRIKVTRQGRVLLNTITRELLTTPVAIRA